MVFLLWGYFIMHMSDALVSPVVGGVLWAGAVGVAAYSVRKLAKDDLMESKKVPMMGVMGAFVFAAQMINFTIPGTGSSGHIGGGLLLAALLGPEAGFLVLMAVLAIQGLFFADGGLLAMGCNIINMGFYSCFIAYPLIFRPVTSKGTSPGRTTLAAVLAVVAGLQLGAFSVVLETLASGRTQLPFGSFLLLMQPIHLAIGVVEGLITAAVLVFLRRAAPEALPDSQTVGTGGFPKRAVAIVAALALVTGGSLSWLASTHPDGLEWSIAGVAGASELAASGAVYDSLGQLQGKTAFLPDYGFRAPAEDAAEEADAQWPAVSAGTSVAGVVGSVLTLALAVAAGLLLWLPRRRRAAQAARDAA